MTLTKVIFHIIQDYFPSSIGFESYWLQIVLHFSTVYYGKFRADVAADFGEKQLLLTKQRKREVFNLEQSWIYIWRPGKDMEEIVNSFYNDKNLQMFQQTYYALLKYLTMYPAQILSSFTRSHYFKVIWLSII